MDKETTERAIALQWWVATVFVTGALLYGIAMALSGGLIP